MNHLFLAMLAMTATAILIGLTSVSCTSRAFDRMTERHVTGMIPLPEDPMEIPPEAELFPVR